MLSGALTNLVENRALSPDQLVTALTAIMAGQCSEAQTAAFLTALRLRGETAQDLAVAARVLRTHAVPFASDGRNIVDTCGTGGDGLRTYNVSTAAALVVAAAGVPVVKHGNRGVSSSSGSADVLAALGVAIDVDPARTQRGFADLGFAFCFAPRFHPAMRHVAAVRKQLQFRTLFNLLGPLCNPAQPRRQLLGVGQATYLPIMANALLELGAEHAFVVQGADGLDEVSLSGPTNVCEVRGGSLRQTTWEPDDFGLPVAATSALRVEDAAESATWLRRVLQGERTPHRDVTLANAAAALVAAGAAADLRDGVAMAAQTIDSGKGFALLQRLTAPPHT